MSRILRRWFLLAALAAAVPPGAAPQETGQGVLARIQSRGELRVGVLATPQFPYSFLQAGSPAGLDIDLAAQIADLLEVRLAVDSAFGGPGALLDALAEGRVDIALSKYKRNLDDALRVRFSAPYSYINYVLLVNRVGFAALKAEGTPEEVFGTQAAAIGTLDSPGYRQHLARHFPLSEVALYSTTRLLYEGLLDRGCVAAFVDAAQARQLLSERPELGLWIQYVELPYISDAVCMATGWQSSFFAAWLDIFIDSRGKLPTLEELFQDYGSEVPYGEQ